METQYIHLRIVKRHLARYFILLVDDWECQISKAEKMTFRAIEDFEFKTHLYIRLPSGEDQYHCGQGLFVLENIM